MSLDNSRAGKKSARKYIGDGPKSTNLQRATKSARKYDSQEPKTRLPRSPMQRQRLVGSPRKSISTGSRAPRMSTATVFLSKSSSSKRPKAWLDSNFKFRSTTPERDSSVSSSDEEQVPIRPRIFKSARKKRVSSPEPSDIDNSASPPPELSDPEELSFRSPPATPPPSEEILITLQQLVGPLIRLQRNHRLPFLRWNLQRGFQSYCHSVGINVEEDDETPEIRIVYRQIRGEKWETTLNSWSCPLCSVHGVFKCRTLLEKHLEWDHKDVHVRWLKREIFTQRPVWTIRVTIPQLEQDNPTAPSSTLFDIAPLPVSISSSAPPPERNISSPIPLKAKRSPSPETLPTPPRERDPLGPVACKPYFPAKSEYDGPDMEYSCRPGGGRIYDLLGTLPMEPYGVLSWLVLDKEDEIFDSDMKDEHKVMHALWARWILLNRNIFIHDFYSGTLNFVDCYWKMIYRAAGWRALRYWLLLLLTNRFLTGPEVANILRRYENLIAKLESDV